MAVVEAQFYTVSDDPRVIGKDLTNTVGQPVNCQIWDTSTLTEPRLVLAYDASIFGSANYVHLGAPFNRYYFMSPPGTVSGGRMVVNCTVDVRESFKDGIEALTPLVKRREDFDHGLLVDQYLPFNAGYSVTYISSEHGDTAMFPLTADADDVPCVVLEVIGTPGETAPKPRPEPYGGDLNG